MHLAQDWNETSKMNSIPYSTRYRCGGYIGRARMGTDDGSARAHLMKYLRCALSICTHCVRVLMRTYKIRETPSVLVYIQSTCYVPSYVVEVIAARPAMRPCGAHLLTVQCGKEVTFWARCAVCLLAIIIIAQSSISSSSLFVFTSEVYSRATLARTATYINWWQWR